MTHHSFEASGLEIWNTCTICDRRAEWPEVNVISDVSNQHDCAADASLTSLIVIGSIYGFSWRGRKNMLNMSSLTAKEKQCLHSPIAIIHRNYIQDHCIFLVFFLQSWWISCTNYAQSFLNSTVIFLPFQFEKIFENVTAFYWNAAHCTLKMMKFKQNNKHYIFYLFIHFHCCHTFVSQQSVYSSEKYSSEGPFRNGPSEGIKQKNRSWHFSTFCVTCQLNTWHCLIVSL